MKQPRLLAAILFPAAAAVLFSCSSVRSLEIETYNPAAITFPPEIQTVMIVNNAAQQPDNTGHQRKRAGKGVTEMQVSADSTAAVFCLQLGKSIAASPVFYDVRLCEDTLRRDSVFYDKRPFSAHDVQALCDDYGVDALISLDNFVLLTEVDETGFNGYFFEPFLRVTLFGELRALWPGQKEVYTFPFSDSLRWLLPDDSQAANITEADVLYAMRYLSSVTGEKVQVNFVPYWSYDNRWYYTAISSEWKRGAACAAVAKWNEAAGIWETLLSKTGKWNPKARLLSNLALCSEIAGDFEKAVGYAEESYRLFVTNAGEDNDYTKLQKMYLEILKGRAKNDSVLSRQLRESN
ncbi:MAG: tetratricopeptide repeat protein [Tannerella sp.]|jgi:hypothetical protein|nr:tetratricopeptide repeat protein [Tannerella sp.]